MNFTDKFLLNLLLIFISLYNIYHLLVDIIYSGSKQELIFFDTE